MGIPITATMGFLFTMTFGIQFTVSSSGSASNKRARHGRLRLGRTLSSPTIWEIVFSHLTASMVTLALKAA